MYYATPERPFPPTYVNGGKSTPIMEAIDQQLKPWESPTDKLIREIAEILVLKGIGLKLFGWCGVRWYAEVRSVSDGRKLPTTICGLLVMWQVFPIFGESARRAIIPSSYQRIIDNTSYQPALRPGILLESNARTGTISGVPVRDPQGNCYFTIAEYGFKLEGDAEVHHSRYMEGDRLIGRFEHVKRNTFPRSDIGLAKLEGGLTYSIVSFDGDEVDGITLRGLAKSEDVPIGAQLFIDNPYNGRCAGISGWRGVNVEDPIDPKYPEHCYLHTSMVYFGNGANDISPGSCGSAF